jgi:transcription termination factor Rho
MSTTALERPTAASSRVRVRDRTRPRVESAPPESAPPESLVAVAGILDRQDQHGFLRTAGYLPGPSDLYVPPAVIREYGLRAGDLVEGAAAPPQRQPQPHSSTPHGKPPTPAKARPLARVDAVNGRPPGEAAARKNFAAMIPLHPQQRLHLETDPGRRGTRIIDLLAPIGKGQRGLIVAQPKTGKTMILQAIAQAIAENHPETHLMLVLLDERPEEVTDMRRSVADRAEVLASTFDRPAHEHIALAELAVERAKRLAERGEDVVILLDSLTRLCRAHNNNAKAGGRTLSGGVDAAAVSGPKQLFGAARNLEDGGSLTILATALIDTGSRADDYFFEELKSTGNMELRLDRALADKRIYPAIDVAGSSTRREELLLSADELDATRRLRRVLRGQTNQQAVELLLEQTKRTASNAEFLRSVRLTAPSGT